MAPTTLAQPPSLASPAAPVAAAALPLLPLRRPGSAAAPEPVRLRVEVHNPETQALLAFAELSYG